MKNKNTNQQTIFEWLKNVETLRQAQGDSNPGSMDIDAELRAAVSEDIKHAKDDTGRELSRYEVAAKMSELVGFEITASMLYSWTADSKEKHRFPCQFLPAFVIATGGQRRTVEVISRHSGLFLLPGPEALRAEIQRLDEEIRKLSTEKNKRKLFLREMEE